MVDAQKRRASARTSALGGDPAEAERYIPRRGLDTVAELGYQVAMGRVTA
jgi:hypothetical protein